MAGNRVRQELVAAFAEFADEFWDGIMTELRTALSQPAPKPTDKDYWKAITFRQNAIQRLMVTVKLMAQAKSGAIHPTGQNTETERAVAAEWLAKAKRTLGEDRGKEEADDE